MTSIDDVQTELQEARKYDNWDNVTSSTFLIHAIEALTTVIEGLVVVVRNDGERIDELERWRYGYYDAED